MNDKITSLSHNVCYRNSRLRFGLGDIVTFSDVIYVVLGVDLSCGNIPRYFLRDDHNDNILVYEDELKPFVNVGDHVDIGFYPVAGTVNMWTVRKINREKDRLFVFNKYINGGYGFWCDIKDVIYVERK